MSEAVLHELHAGKVLGEVVHVGFLDFDLELLSQLVFSQLPTQTVQCLLPLLLNLLVGEFFVGSLEPALQELLGEADLLHFLHHGSLDVNAEAVLGIVVHLGLHVGFHLLAELFLALDGTFAEHFVEQLLIDLGRDDLRSFLLLLLSLFAFGFLLLRLLLHLAVPVGVGLYLLLHHFVGHLYIVVRDLVAGGEFAVELGSQSDVEHKGEGVLAVEIQLRSLLLIGEGLAQDIEFFFTNVVVQLLADHFVDGLSQDGFAVHFLHQTGGHFTGSEAGNVGFLTDSANLFLYLFCVVCGLHHEGDFGHQIFRFGLTNLHVFMS